MSSKDTMNKTKEKLKKLFSEFKENISEGAEQFGKISSELLEETKKKASEWYDYGSEQFERASASIYDYTERHKNNNQIKKLVKLKNEKLTAFGDKLFHEYKKKGRIDKRFLQTKKISAIVEEITLLDKEIINTGKKLDED